ncbi:MarR family transcriptional regulator [Streptomyces sp. CA-111067]|uniref:MarR family transcriptional regulator n=1 Tax=Streptomyces sp. CA-111067 TaxID=3240046 RepID=UPI003D9656F5
MAYRIHFTVQDLARTRVAEVPPPLFELSTAVRVLRDREHPVRFDAWRRRVRQGLRPQARMMFDLVPPLGVVPGFLAAPGIGSPREMLDRARATPRSVVRADLAHVAEHQPLPSWTRQLPDDRDLLRALFDSLEHVYGQVLEPHWEQVRSLAAADRSARMRQVLGGGMEVLLAAVNPGRIRWRPPVLEVTMASGYDDDLYLRGQGLLLVPSAFGVEAPVIDPDAEPQPVLTYPAGIDPHARSLPVFATAPDGDEGQGRRAPTAGSLASLVGHTRAGVLHTIAEHPGCSTKELAVLVGIAPASASEHATTLREAGLVSTTRNRNAVLHSPTSLGVSLLNGGQAAPGRA